MKAGHRRIIGFILTLFICVTGMYFGDVKVDSVLYALLWIFPVPALKLWIRLRIIPRHVHRKCLVSEELLL